MMVLLIGLATVPDSDYRNGLNIVVNFVNHSIVAYANAIKIIFTSQLLHTSRAWFGFEGVYGFCKRVLISSDSLRNSFAADALN